MRTIIAGSRSFNDYRYLWRKLEKYRDKISVVVSGHAKGTDSLGEQWAKENNIPIKIFKADWEKHGKSAGIKRNYEMAKHADMLIAFWNGKSRGTSHMIYHAHSVGLKVIVFRFDEK